MGFKMKIKTIIMVFTYLSNQEKADWKGVTGVEDGKEEN